VVYHNGILVVYQKRGTMKTRNASILAGIALTLAACGHAAAPAARAASPNVLACQHFQQQGDWYRNLATPTLIDDAQAVSWVKADSELATDPQLKAAFLADYRQLSAALDPQAAQPTGNPADTVKSGCARFGVPVSFGSG
jgi:hypothetical protein